ncbi:acetyl/propionyl-CoA carboxylase alpha subunit [Streptacidiphilus sp. BW17]|uniref:ATP-binding protein n=1 Tax=Streptacidiphilus sp. BW17 TaxID=3156274 RepID=UPI003517C57D
MPHVLIANRAAIAVRAAKTLRALGATTTAVAAETDLQSGHVRSADNRVDVPGWGLPDTYDSPRRMLGAALLAGVDVVYPGYGSLAENADFVAGLEAAGIRFVGPSSAALRLAGSKAEAIATAARIGVPVLAHASAVGVAETLACVQRLGLPVILKPEHGYGGQAVRIAHTEDQARRVVEASPATHWYVEEFLPHNRVIGICLAITERGEVIELGERESLLSVSGLKLLEASPVAGIEPDMLDRMRADAVRVAREIGLKNVMTVEFIVDEDRYYFLEVNGRLPLAYQMSEAQTGLDLVDLQTRIARGEAIDPSTVAVDRTIHCLEARFFVHPDELTDFPRVGSLDRLRFADVDDITYACSIDPAKPLDYELIVAQALCTALERQAAARSLRKAIENSEISGLNCFQDEILDRLNAER